ncbi:MAG: acyltransferase family protein [Candidatus Acidiferrales bacterium]
MELDGLRGLCALCVVLYHYLSGPAVYSDTASRIRELIYVSPFTVDMFFILSGFLVGGILLNTRTSPNYYKTFYLRRLYRVAPIYYLWIAAFVAAALCVPAARASLLPKSFGPVAFVAGCIFFVQNFPRFPVWLTRAHWFSTTWTLAIEEHFYMLAPLCLHRVGRRRLIGGLAAIIVLSPFARTFAWHFNSMKDATELDGGVANLWTPFRADGLAMGILLAILWQTPHIKAWICKHVKWIYSGLVFGAPVCVGIEYMAVKHVRYADALAVGFGRSAVEVWSLCLIFVALMYQGKEKVSFMRWRPFREVGKISYCVYLIHWGVLWAVLRFGFHALPGTSVRSDALASVVALILTFGLSALSWKYFEGPLQKRGHRFTY